MKKLATCMAALALCAAQLSGAQAALIFTDDMNSVGGDWRYWAAHWDESGGFQAGRINFTGGSMNFSANYDFAVSTKEVNKNSIVKCDVSATSFTAGGFFTIGLGGATAGGDRIDADLYEDSGTVYVGVWLTEAGNYGSSGVALSPQPAINTFYKMIVDRQDNVVTVTLTSLDELTVYATTSRDVSGANGGDFGLLYIKNAGFEAKMDNLQIYDKGAAATVKTYDFAYADLTAAAQDWFVEINPQETLGAGMRIFNFASFPGQLLATRPDFQTPGYMAVRGVAPDGYSRVPSRYAPPQGFNYFGNVDILAKLRFDAGDALFSLGLDNRTNEGQRRAILLDTRTSSTRNGVNNPSLHIVDNAAYPVTIGAYIASASLNGLWDPGVNPDIYIYVQRNGNDVTAWASNLGNGSAYAGSTINGSIAGANPSGQLVITAHTGVVKVDEMSVWDYGTATWGSAVDEWTLY